MCSCFSPLLKAIDVYLAKADGDLKDELDAEGYAESGGTVDAISRLEDSVAAALVEETELFRNGLDGAETLAAFAETVWPELRKKDELAKKLAALFKATFSELIPDLADAYIKQTDSRLSVTETSRMVTDFVEQWSEKLDSVMICITGDTHGDFHRFATKCFPQQKKMNRDDCIIITGDFGGLWNGSREENVWLDWLEDKPFTTLFIDGNQKISRC